MSKVKDAKYEELKKKADKPTIESAYETLNAQFKDYTEKYEYYKVLKIKTQGAIEVLAQLKDANGDA